MGLQLRLASLFLNAENHNTQSSHQVRYSLGWFVDVLLFCFCVNEHIDACTECMCICVHMHEDMRREPQARSSQEWVVFLRFVSVLQDFHFSF